MRLNSYLVVSHQPKNFRVKPKARITSKPPKLSSHEIVMRLNLDIPDELFQQPQLEANIAIPANAVNAPVIEALVLNNIQQEIERQTGIDLTISVIETQ